MPLLQNLYQFSKREINESLKSLAVFRKYLELNDTENSLTIFMGQEESKAIPRRRMSDYALVRNHNKKNKLLMFPENFRRMESCQDPIVCEPSSVPAAATISIMKMSFTAVWSIRYPDSMAPIARNAQFNAYSDELQILFTGYGKDVNGDLLNDIWMFDAKTGWWNQLRITGPGKPRKYCSASVYGNYLVIYGGRDAHGDVTGLELIDLERTELTVVEAYGDVPPALTSPVLELYENKVFLWGGRSDFGISNDLYVLDLSKLTWKRIKCDVDGRTAAAWKSIGSKIYVYGGSSDKNLVVIDMVAETVSSVLCSGAHPPSNVSAAGMANVDGMLMYFGGYAKSQWSFVYCLDITKMWWFVFHVVPDNETTKAGDGLVNEFGLFMVPRIHHFGVGYIKEKRTVFATLGYPLREPPPLFELNLHDGLAVMHMRDDMSDFLKMMTPVPPPQEPLEDFE